MICCPRRTAAAHPRSRGENRRSPGNFALKKGSSPLTRGKRARGDLDRPPVRLIPAHAGKTASQPRESCSLAAHPRSRGENGERRGASMSIGGSSPLTRGKPATTRPELRGGRLIPAHAGKTASQPRESCSLAAHPRSRGENGERRGASMSIGGSSPLTRGKRGGRRRLRRQVRLIPAHAGKTFAVRLQIR